MQNENPQAEADRDQLRFLRYRREVVRGWQPSEEKEMRLRAIAAAIRSLAEGPGEVAAAGIIARAA
jgi:hypothetical protein